MIPCAARDAANAAGYGNASATRAFSAEALSCALGGPGALGALAVVGVEAPLAQADRLWRHFDELVVLDVGQRLLKRHLHRWSQTHRLVLGVGSDIGELLALEHVDLEIIVARVLADDHALIYLPARLDHHRAAILDVPHRIGDRFACLV